MFLAHVNLIIAVFTVAVVFKYKAETKRLGFKYPPDHGKLMFTIAIMKQSLCL